MNVLLTQLLILQVMLLTLVQPALTQAMAIHLDLQVLLLVLEAALGTGVILLVMGQRLTTHGEPENLRKAILKSKGCGIDYLRARPTSATLKSEIS